MLAGPEAAKVARTLSLIADAVKLIAAGGYEQAQGALRQAANQLDEMDEALDRYYVCDQCGHYWCSPEHPDQCENCRASASYLMVRDTLAEAEEASELALTTER